MPQSIFKMITHLSVCRIIRLRVEHDCGVSPAELQFVTQVVNAEYVDRHLPDLHAALLHVWKQWSINPVTKNLRADDDTEPARTQTLVSMARLFFDIEERLKSLSIKFAVVAEDAVVKAMQKVLTEGPRTRNALSITSPKNSVKIIIQNNILIYNST